MLTDIRALADHFLIALPNINTCLSQTCSVYGPGTPAAPLRALVLPGVPAPGSAPAPRVPPRSPVSLYDACVLMSGVRDARDAMLMQVDIR